MTISMFQASVPAYLRMLSNTKVLLEKGAAFCAAKKIEESVLVNGRLAPDMFPLSRQVQIATDFAKGSTARLAGLEIPKYDDNEKSFADLIARIDKTMAFVATVTAVQIDGQEDREINLTIGGKPINFKGQAYLIHFVLPNFHFHLAMLYAILRHNGVEVGKSDFLGGV